MLALTDAFNRLVLGRSAVGRAVRAQVIRALVQVGPVRRKLVGRLTGIGIAYPAERGAHAWIGRRSPDLAVVDGRLYEQLRDGRFLLVDRTHASLPELPGTVRVVRGPRDEGPGMVLVRPDGYVAWAADGPDVAGAGAAVARWCPGAVGVPAGH